MKWTYNTPTECGAYYHKPTFSAPGTLVYVNSNQNFIAMFGSSHFEPMPKRIVDQWLGPITPDLFEPAHYKIIFRLDDIPDFFSDNFARKMIDKINKQFSIGMKFNID